MFSKPAELMPAQARITLLKDCPTSTPGLIANESLPPNSASKREPLVPRLTLPFPLRVSLNRPRTLPPLPRRVMESLLLDRPPVTPTLIVEDLGRKAPEMVCRNPPPPPGVSIDRRTCSSEITFLVLIGVEEIGDRTASFRTTSSEMFATRVAMIPPVIERKKE